jgi:endonuclease YncB( thermonuclease family)
VPVKNNYSSVYSSFHFGSIFEKSINQTLINNGYAKAYDGGTKEGWGELE